MAKFNCPRCDSAMESNGFKTHHNKKKRRYRCVSCRYKAYEDALSKDKISISTDEILQSIQVTVQSSPQKMINVTTVELSSSFETEDFFETEDLTEHFFRDCDCDSVLLNVLGCVIHSPRKSVNYVLKVPSDVYRLGNSFHKLDGSFCQLYDAYFKR